mgnify:CR=1 FL=1
MSKKPLRVLVLVHETLVPPESTDGYSPQEVDEWRTEYDVTSSLKAMGHEVRALGMGDNLAELRSTIMEWKPDVAFNLLEEFQGIVTYDQYVVAFLELLRVPYTGCNPRGMMISRDKALSKQILAYHRIPTARFVLLPRNRRYREPRRLKFPLFVKSATEDASLGISQASIVHDGQKLKERVEFIHEQTSSDALVEEYIEGREIYIGLVTDDPFGPVITFGAGGTMIELIDDRAMELPPLNLFLARRLLERARVAHRQRIIPMHYHLGSQHHECLHQVVGERIVVVDQQ